MEFNGHVENGVVVFEGEAPPEGTEVTVQPKPSSTSPTVKFDFFEHYKSVIGKADGLPEDAALNVNHYLYGHPKQDQS